MRRLKKIGVSAAVVALATAAVTTGTASAASSGNGSSQASTSLVTLDLGQNGPLLNLVVVGDTGLANTDPKVGTSSASSSLSPVTVSSSVSQLNDISLPKVSVSSTGAPQTKSVPSTSLGTPLSSGTIAPLSLAAAVDAAQGATSGLTSKVSNLSVLGGVLTVPSIDSNMGAAAKPLDSDGLRGVQVPSIQVLNLAAVLQGLGITSPNMTVAQVGNTLSAIAATVPYGSGTLNGQELIATVEGVTDTLTSAVPDGIAGLPGGTPVPGVLPPELLAILNGLFPGGAIPPGVTNVTGLTTALTDLRTNLLTDALDAIIDAPLLSVTNLTAGLATKAADTVENSSASIAAGVGSVKIGNLPALPGVDLASTAAQVTTLVNTAQGQLNDVLNAAGLGDLISVKVLDQSKNVASDKGYVSSQARLTGLKVTIASLTAGGTSQAVTDTMGQLLGAGNVPALSPAMAAVNSALGGGTPINALGQGTSVEVLSVSSTSAFAVTTPGTSTNPAAPTPSNGTLAVTGGSTQLLGLVGLFLLAGVVGLRWLRRPASTN